MADRLTRDLALEEPNDLVARRLEVEAFERLLQLRLRLKASSEKRPGWNPRAWNNDTKHLGNAYQRLKRDLEKAEREGRR
jgi:hypothetical protein